MRKINKSILSFIFVLAVNFTGAPAANAGDVAIIANNNIKASEISQNDLRDIFLGEKSSLDGSRANPVTLNKGPAHQAFLDQLGKNDAAFRAMWRKQVFTGKGSMPRAFDTEEALAAYVSATPGAIGYVSGGKASACVKVLKLK
jgi:ABC-type phosphate transport system substrate-binding protein